MNKVKLILGHMTFLEQPNKTIVHSIDEIFEVNPSMADTVGEALISSNLYESYLVPTQYKGQIVYDCDSPDLLSAIKEASHYLSDSENSLKDMVIAIINEPDGDKMIDDVEGVTVWEAVENRFNCDEFLSLIGY